MRDKGEQFDFLGNLALVRKKLYLAEVHRGGELNDDLLGILTELRTLPAFRVHRRVEQLSHWELCVFARAVNDAILEFHLLLTHFFVL